MSDLPPRTVPRPAAGGPTTVGFLSVVTDSSGVYGGYLLTNAWGRPLEFRLSSAVQPTKVQHILYGPTMTEYLHADLIGKTLIDKTAHPPGLVVTDTLAALAVGDRVGAWAVSVAPADGFGTRSLATPKASAPLTYRATAVPDVAELVAVLDGLDAALDLVEPFARIREAMTEARKVGVNRVA